MFDLFRSRGFVFGFVLLVMGRAGLLRGRGRHALGEFVFADEHILWEVGASRVVATRIAASHNSEA